SGVNWTGQDFSHPFQTSWNSFTSRQIKDLFGNVNHPVKQNGASSDHNASSQSFFQTCLFDFLLGKACDLLDSRLDDLAKDLFADRFGLPTTDAGHLKGDILCDQSGQSTSVLSLDPLGFGN